MAHSGKTITFATDLIPNENKIYNLGDSNHQWILYGQISGNSKIFYGTCSTRGSTAQKDVVCSAFTSDDLIPGTVIHVLFTNKNTAAVANLKLKVNNTNAINIKKIYYTSGVTNLTNAAELPANGVVSFVYTGDVWQVIGVDYNTNTNTLLRTYTGNANHEYPLLAQNSSANATSGWTEYTSSYKDYYGVIPNNSTTRATINLSTGHITVPGGISGNLTGNVTGNVTGNLTGNADTATVASKLTTNDLGNVTKPIYLDDGTAKACNDYAGGTAVTLNGTNLNAQAASFYAPINAGSTIGVPLINMNSNNAPVWYSGLILTGAGSNDSPYNASFSGTVDIQDATNITGNTTIGNSTTPSTLTVWGNVGIGTGSNDSYKLYVNGTTYLNSDVTVNGNIIPSNTNYTLGSANTAAQDQPDNGKRWAHVYIGDADTHGNVYAPIYWNNGVPAVADSVIQYATFTIPVNSLTLSIQHAAYTAATQVLQIVVDANSQQYLNSPITWTSSAGTITLSRTSSDYAISGYIITAQGATIQPTTPS